MDVKEKAHLERLERGDHFALLAYLECNDAHDRPLPAVRDFRVLAQRLGADVERGLAVLHEAFERVRT